MRSQHPFASSNIAPETTASSREAKYRAEQHCCKLSAYRSSLPPYYLFISYSGLDLLWSKSKQVGGLLHTRTWLQDVSPAGIMLLEMSDLSLLRVQRENHEILR